MEALADKMYCCCGKLLEEHMKTISWRNQNDKLFTIHNSPFLKCSDSCGEDILHPLDVEINLSVIADQMESGKLNSTVEYFNIIKK